MPMQRRYASPFRLPVAAILLWLLLRTGASECQAAGFSLYEQSPAGTALAGAMTARPDDASAIFYNPAGLGFQSGLSGLVGFTLITAQPSATQYGPGAGVAGSTFDAQRGLFVLPTLFVAARLHDVVSIGLGGFANYGLGVDWQDDNDPRAFPGRYQAQRANLQTFTLNPTIALRPVPEVSLAVGLDVVLGSVELVRALNFGDADGRIALAAGAAAIGGNVGALVRLLGGGLTLGFSYRSSAALSFREAKVGYTPPSGASSRFPFTTGETKIPLPHLIAAGLAVHPLSWLIISADVNAVLWSETQELRLTLTDASGKLSQTSVIPRHWRDTYAARLGFEASLAEALPAGAPLVPKIRFGFAYDQTPVPASTLEPSLPDSDRFLGALGVSLGYRGLGSVDLGYSAVFFRPRTAENPDLRLAYDMGTAHIFSAALVISYDRILAHRAAGFGGLFD